MIWRENVESLNDEEAQLLISVLAEETGKEYQLSDVVFCNPEILFDILNRWQPKLKKEYKPVIQEVANKLFKNISKNG